MEFLDLESIPGVETVPVKMLTLFVTILAATAMVLGDSETTTEKKPPKDQAMIYYGEDCNPKACIDICNTYLGSSYVQDGCEDERCICNKIENGSTTTPIPSTTEAKADDSSNDESSVYVGEDCSKKTCDKECPTWFGENYVFTGCDKEGVRCVCKKGQVAPNKNKEENENKEEAEEEERPEANQDAKEEDRIHAGKRHLHKNHGKVQNQHHTKHHANKHHEHKRHHAKHGHKNHGSHNGINKHHA